MIHLLGSPFIRIGHDRVALSISRPFLLLAYLAFYQEWIKRDELAFFLRPDADKETGQQYLRKLISNARKFSWSQSLEVEAKRLRWQIDTDIKQFRHARKRECWREAVQCYRGPLMGKLDVPSLPSYDTWLQIERESLDSEWRDVSLRYICQLESSGQHFEAAALANRLLESDPFDENAVQGYLRNTYLTGQRERALKAAHDFELRLRAELELDPTLATRQLVEAVRLARPIEKPDNPVRYGRRRSDAVRTSRLADQLPDDLITLLGIPDSRLISARPGANDETTLTIAVRVGQTSTVLLSIIDLAAQLIDKQHKARALELLLLVLNHPDCGASVKEEVDKLWPGLDKLANPSG